MASRPAAPFHQQPPLPPLPLPPPPNKWRARLPACPRCRPLPAATPLPPPPRRLLLLPPPPRPPPLPQTARAPAVAAATGPQRLAQMLLCAAGGRQAAQERGRRKKQRRRRCAAPKCWRKSPRRHEPRWLAEAHHKWRWGGGWRRRQGRRCSGRSRSQCL